VSKVHVRVVVIASVALVEDKNAIGFSTVMVAAAS
jgi:hypothetical protein